MVRVYSFGALTRYGRDLNSLSEIFVVLFNVCFELPIQPIAVNRQSTTSVRIDAVWDWTAVNKVGVWRYVVMSAISAVFSDKCRHVMFFLQ